MSTETRLILDRDLYADSIFRSDLAMMHVYGRGHGLTQSRSYQTTTLNTNRHRNTVSKLHTAAAGASSSLTHHTCQSPTSPSSSAPSSTMFPRPLTLTTTLGTPNPTPENGVYFFTDRRQDAEHRSPVATAAAA